MTGMSPIQGPGEVPKRPAPLTSAAPTTSPTQAVPEASLHSKPRLNYANALARIESLIKATNQAQNINADIAYASGPKDFAEYHGPIAVLILETHEWAGVSNPEQRRSKIALGEALLNDSELDISNWLYEGPPMSTEFQNLSGDLAALQEDHNTTITAYLLKLNANKKGSIQFRSAEKTAETLEHCVLRLLMNQIKLASAIAARNRALETRYKQENNRIISIIFACIMGDGNIDANSALYHRILNNSINNFGLNEAMTSSNKSIVSERKENLSIPLPSLLSPLSLSTGRTADGKEALLTPTGFQAWTAILQQQKEILQKRNATITSSFKHSSGLTPMVVGARHIHTVDQVEAQGVPVIVIRPSQNSEEINNAVKDFWQLRPN